ncbi:MAG: response regulator, partial [Erysipelotrichaceae bacterium]
MKKILIVEDDIDIIELLNIYLVNNNYQVYSTDDGNKAVEMIDIYQIDLVVADIMMPILSGYDLVKKIRQKHEMPIIILSAKVSDSDKVLGLNLGADVYLSKPFNPLE